MTREQAVQILKDEYKCHYIDCDLKCSICDLFVNSDELEAAYKVAIKELKTGKWLKEDRGRAEYSAICSECEYGTYWSNTKYFNYCPYCGARMEIEE